MTTLSITVKPFYGGPGDWNLEQVENRRWGTGQMIRTRIVGSAWEILLIFRSVVMRTRLRSRAWAHIQVTYCIDIALFLGSSHFIVLGMIWVQESG